MNTILELERLGYHFDLQSGALRCHGPTPPSERAQALLEEVKANQAQAIQFLEQRGVNVRIENLETYLAARGYRIVRAEWPQDEPCPRLIVEEK